MFGFVHRPLDDDPDARHRPVGRRHGPRGRHPDAQLAALRLLPARSARRRVRLPPRSANALGAFIGPLVGGILAQVFGWRVPFFVFVIPTVVFVILGLRLQGTRPRPLRTSGRRRRAQPSSQTDEVPPSCAESVRILWQVRTLRRIWYSLPFLAASFIGLVVAHVALLRAGLRPRRVAARLRRRDRRARAGRRHPARHPARVAADAAATRARPPLLVGRRRSASPARGSSFALAPVLWVAIVMPTSSISGLAALLAPGIFASLSLAIPPKVRSLGLLDGRRCSSCPACIVLYIVGGIADRYGIRQGLLIMVPIFLIGALILVVGVAVREVRHQPGVDLDRRAGRGALPAVAGRGEAAARPQRRRAATTACRCCSASTSRSTKARSSRCSARTARASRRC